MDVRTILFKAGIPTYISKIITSIPTGPASQLEIPISKTIPKQIGLIFGMAIYTDGVDPANNPLITSNDATNLYLNFKDGPTLFEDSLRLSDLNFNPSGFPNVNDKRYLDVNIPGNFDISTSSYTNPTGIISNNESGKKTVITLQLWFISTDSYIWLMDKGYVDKEYAEQFIKSKAR